MSNLHIDYEKLESVTEKLKVIRHPYRIRIIELLHQHEQLTPNELQALLELSQAATSNHLKLMRVQQLIRFKRAGKNKIYSINRQVFEGILDCLKNCI
jgi:DNA-binding transcriptional ArsR family regulator